MSGILDMQEYDEFGNFIGRLPDDDEEDDGDQVRSEPTCVGV